MDNKLKHLEFIQNVINRLSTNSFLLKGWTVVLVSALFALSANDDTNISFIMLAYIPAIIFWGLDGYFLYTERIYRKYYDRVRQKADNEIDLSMDTSDIESGVSDWVCAMLSKTLFPFYISIIVAISIRALVIFGRV